MNNYVPLCNSILILEIGCLYDLVFALFYVPVESKNMNWSLCKHCLKYMSPLWLESLVPELPQLPERKF